MQFITSEKKAEIKQLLVEIEQKYDISIIHAVESGSRAWGFPSQDSDYDIRFIYHHRKDWYLSAFEKKDTIEMMLDDGVLDAGGWDISKCIRLLYKGNAALYEWLEAPVAYKSVEKVTPLKELAKEHFYCPAVFYHYMSLAKKKLMDPKTRTHAKSFLYGLRALLCANWVSREGSAPPVLFDPLVDKYLSVDLQACVRDLLIAKAAGGEQEKIDIDHALWHFSESLYQSLQYSVVTGKKTGSNDPFDRVFKGIIFSKD